ncbi:endonuclease/exonuclease/phosphatase family protein [Paenibacillus allorhizosphaerae]|uniref:Endonuclease/exonuclease/phosphatase domain-containing protein n=1 Tax=Paenibacillus allorhizosphaerae TaxID=2849866 RepID=A0ABM8VDD1_9BACL|nr:endonuclease/exonuclease/phosphatase family protein [Paenibacillus allorhizosphaerae]CAG7627284.1 hypothetical protein PAECIP111802_01336 [Paenibacillus allorhizosphaerae]
MKEDRKLERERETKLRVMSYNIHSGIGMDNEYDLNRIAGEIRESGAHIVGLQEADVHWGKRSRFEDGIALLAEQLDMHAFFAPIYELPPLSEGQPERKFGVAVLSRYPIVRARNHAMTRLSTLAQDRDRGPAPMPGFAEAVLDVDGTGLTVYVVHLDFRPDPAVRIVQIREMLNMLAHNEAPRLLLGDFNARPNAAEFVPLFQAMNDSWTDVHQSDDGLTFPADSPDRKIDYILRSSHLRTVSSQVLQTLGSDHRPVIADMLLSKESGV